MHPTVTHLRLLDIDLVLMPYTLPIAGRLQHFVHNWRQVTQDPWLLEAVQGYKLEFSSPPFQYYLPRELVACQETLEGVDQEVQNLEKGAVRPVQRTTGQYLSHLFTVPKKDGTRRPAVNLKPLNAHIQRRHFKMEGTHRIY